MLELARTADRQEPSHGDAPPHVVAPCEQTPTITLHSGLPLRWQAGEPMPPQPPRPMALAIKRGLDIVLSLMALFSLSVLLLAIAVAVKLTSPGPVFFRQTREGLYGRSFAILKFRTLYFDRCDPSGLDQAGKGDARVTRLGRFLRRSALDELPQLLNILLGDMSLVGPRPHVPGMRVGGRPYAALVPHYRLRLTAKPGLSGWAQANGLRGPTGDPETARARIDHDLAYIENFSVALDLWIIWLTVRRELFRGPDA